MTELTQEQIEKLARLAEATENGDNPAALNSRMAFIAAASPTTVLALIALIEARDAEIKRLRSLCDAAALEITDYWDAHCDAEGFGPVSLLNRLKREQGGGYIDKFTATKIKSVMDELDALRPVVEASRDYYHGTDNGRVLDEHNWRNAVRAYEANMKEPTHDQR